MYRQSFPVPQPLVNKHTETYINYKYSANSLALFNYLLQLNAFLLTCALLQDLWFFTSIPFCVSKLFPGWLAS